MATANLASAVYPIVKGLQVEVEEVIPQETQPCPSSRSRTVSPNRGCNGGESSRLSPALCLNEFANGFRQLGDNLGSLTVAIHDNSLRPVDVVLADLTRYSELMQSARENNASEVELVTLQLATGMLHDEMSTRRYINACSIRRSANIVVHTNNNEYNVEDDDDIV
jgi:hypothetical protein